MFSPRPKKYQVHNLKFFEKLGPCKFSGSATDPIFQNKNQGHRLTGRLATEHCLTNLSLRAKSKKTDANIAH